ncbi:MAG: DUF736 domain-containing protein [Pseudomonadota bacterium]
MANALGYVSETDIGYKGELAMIGLSTPIRILLNADKTAPNQPDFRIFAGEAKTEIGAAWLKQAKSSGRDYISLTLATPEIGPRKIYASLAPIKGSDGRHVIRWNPKD